LPSSTQSVNSDIYFQKKKKKKKKMLLPSIRQLT